MTTTVFFWDFHTFFLCAPMSILTVVLAASAYQRSGGSVHRLAFEKRIAESALRFINARLGEPSQPKGYTRKTLAWSSALLVVALIALLLVVQLLAWGMRAEASWGLGVTAALAGGFASLTLSITRVLTLCSWESGRRIGSVCGWVTGGAVSLLFSFTPISRYARCWVISVRRGASALRFRTRNEPGTVRGHVFIAAFASTMSPGGSLRLWVD